MYALPHAVLERIPQRHHPLAGAAPQQAAPQTCHSTLSRLTERPCRRQRWLRSRPTVSEPPARPLTSWFSLTVRFRHFTRRCPAAVKTPRPQGQTDRQAAVSQPGTPLWQTAFKSGALTKAAARSSFNTIVCTLELSRTCRIACGLRRSFETRLNPPLRTAFALRTAWQALAWTPLPLAFYPCQELFAALLHLTCLPGSIFLPPDWAADRAVIGSPEPPEQLGGASLRCQTSCKPWPSAAATSPARSSRS